MPAKNWKGKYAAEKDSVVPYTFPKRRPPHEAAAEKAAWREKSERYAPTFATRYWRARRTLGRAAFGLNKGPGGVA